MLIKSTGFLYSKQFGFFNFTHLLQQIVNFIYAIYYNIHFYKNYICNGKIKYRSLQTILLAARAETKKNRDSKSDLK